MPDSNNPYASDTSSARLRQLSAMLPHPGPLTQAEVDAANAAPVAVAPAAPAAPPPPSPGIAAWFQRSAPSAPIAQGSAPAPDAGRAQLTPGSIEESVLAAVPPDTTSTNAPAAPSPTGVISKNLEGQEYVRETQRQEQTRPKTAGEANLLSKATKGMFIPDYEGNFHLNGKLMTPADVQKKYPDVWAKINAPKPPVAPVAAQTPEEAHGILDQVLHKLSPAVKADANGDEKTIGDWARGFGDTAKDAAQYATDRVVDTAKDLAQYAADHPGAVPVDLIMAIPKGTYKFGQMVWGGVGGLTQAFGDALTVAGGQSGAQDAEKVGKWLSESGKYIRRLVDSKQVSEAMGLGVEGGEDPFGEFMSNLFSLVPALGLPKAVSLGGLYGATGAGETYGRAEDVQAASGQPVSHMKSAAAAAVAGATNYLAGRMAPEGLNPDAVNPLFTEALPRNVASAAISAAQLSAGHAVARSLYDPAAVPKDWMDALSKTFDGYFKSLATLVGVHAASAYVAYRVANAKDFMGRGVGEETGEKTFDTALLRAQDPSTTRFVTEMIANADSPETAEMMRQRVRAMFERRDAETPGGFFRGHFDTFFPPITAENWKAWGPQIPGVTAPERAPDAPQAKARVDAEKAAEPQPVAKAEPAPAAIPTQPVSREGIEAPKPAVQPSALGKTALDLANERVSKTPKNVLQITTHPNAVRLTDSNGEENRPETITNHTPDTSHMVANRAVANTMRAVMYGSMRIAGVDPETEPDAKKAVENIVNGFSGSRAATKIATAWGQMGVPPVMIDALNATTATLMAQGIDLNRPTVGADTRPIPADVAARRGFEFATEFHKQLDERVHNMGVEAPDWMRDTVARIGKIVEPGGPHDNAVRAGLGLPPAELVPQHVTTPPIVRPAPISQEAPNGQAGEGSTGGQAVQTQEGGAGRGAVAAGAPEGAATQPGQAEAGGGPGAVLGTDHGPAIAAEPGAGPGNEAPAAANAGAVQRSGAQAAADADADPDVRHLSPAMQARVDASVARMKALLEESGVPDGNVSKIDMHTEIVQGTNWATGHTPERGAEDMAGAPRVAFVGPAEMIYPPPAGSPYTHPFNLTSSVAISPEMIVAMGLPPLGDTPSIGTVVHALINADPARLKTAYAALSALGFDSIASTSVTKLGVGVTFSGILEAGKTKSGAPFLNRPWGKRPDGRIGFLSLPDDEVFSYKHPEAELKPKLPDPVPQIEDEAERDKAIQASRELFAKHHVDSMKLIESLRPAGVPMGDEEMELASAKGIEDGVSTADLKDLMQVVSQDQGTSDAYKFQKPTKGTSKDKVYSAENFREYIKAGGLLHVIQGLRNETHFLKDLRSGKRIGRKEFTRVAAGSAVPLVGGKALGSNKVYLRARDEARTLVLGENPKFDEISDELKEGRITPDTTRTLALLSLAAQEYIPHFFSADPHYISDMRMREVQKPELPKLASYFEPRVESEGSFSPALDVYENREVMREAQQGAGHEDVVHTTMAKHISPARRQQLLNQVQDALGARGMSTPDTLGKLGVPLVPRIDHATLHEDTVTKILESPEAEAKILRAVDKEGFKFLTELAPSHLISNGYCGLLLNRLAGMGKRPFHLQAYTSDPNFENHYTIGEETILGLNEYSPDGAPAMESILTHDDMAILLDHNDPRYDTTVERVHSQLANDPQLNGCVTTMRRVVEVTPQGREISRMLPVSRVHANYSRVQTVLQGMGLAPAAQQSTWRGLRIKDPALVRQRLALALGAIIDGDIAWHQKLGGELCEQLATAETALEAVEKADLYALTKGAKGSEKEFGDLTGVASRIAEDAFNDYMGPISKQLRKFVKDTHNRLKAIEDSRVVHAIETPKKIEAIINRLMDEENEKGDVDSALVKAAQKEIDALPHEEDIEAQDALTEAEHVTSGLIRAKNDTPWHEIFPDDGTAMIPGLKPETCITNKAQMMAIVHEMGITADDPKTKYMHEVFAKMHPAVFREMGFQIDMSPDCDTGWFDFRRRLVGISGKLKEMSATRAAIVMAHELSHAFTAYMPLQMQRVLDRWYESEFAKVEAKNPRFADVMKADSISQATNETRSVKMSFTIGGTKANVLVTPDAGKALLEKHPDLKGSLREQFDRSGNTIGYALRSDFAGHSMYRYLSPAEFIAEVGLDAIRYHANGRATGRREVSRHMVDMGPGARAAFNTTWRNIGREIDAIVGKTTMRRFIGNAMSRKIDPNVVNLEKPGYIDHLIPGAPANGPPIHKGDTPEDYAASKYDLASSIGELLAIPRRRIVMAFHTASASDAARNMQYITRPENGFETQLVLSAGGMTAKHYDAIEKMTSPTGADRRALIKALKETPEGQAVSKAAKKSGFAKNIKLMGEKEPFWVKVGPDGKYKRAMTERALMMQDDFVKTGKLPDEFKELEEAMPKLSEFMWHRLQGDLVELCDAIGVPLDSMQSVEDKIIHQGTPPPDTVGQRATPKVKHYIPQVWDGNKQTGIVQNLFGVAPKNKEGLPAAKGVDASSEMGAGTAAREYGFDAPQDINLSAFMLHQREYDGPLDGVQHDRFPLNTNLIDQSNHGTGSAGLVSMAFRVITNALRTGQARIGLPLDKNDPASGFVKLNLKTLGMPDGLLPDAFDNIYINPDALRQMKSAMAPNPFSGSKLYRGVVLLNTAFNSVMLAGLFDWVNGAMMTAHFAADLPVELSRKLEADKRNLKGFDSTANKAAIAGAVAGLVAGGALGGAGMSASGATMGYLGIRALAGLYKARRMMYGGFGDLAAKGREVQNLIESGVQLNPKELPPKTQDFLAAWQVMNPKMMSSPTQIKRSQHLYKALWRNGQWGQATGMALVRAAGKLSLYGDNGLFKAIPGKQQFKQGMLAFAIEGINDRFRDAEGNLDRTNKQWMDALFEISDSSDELIGSAQARNLNQNQTMYAVAQTLFIAWNFTYPTIKAMSIVGADLANNLLGWSGHYRAFKSAATGGGTRQSLPTEGSNWTQRKSTMALKQSFLVGIILARLMSIASHYVYPHSHYTMARAASVAEHEISRQKGTLLGATWGGLATAAPPEGMGIWDSMRHTAFESMAPQLGRDVPSVMRPQRFVPIGAHYLPDIINPMIHPSIHPSILFNYEVQMNRLAEFYKSKSSGVSSSVQAVTTGHDPLGRPLALTGSMANTGWGRAFNKATAAHEGDGFIRDNARAFSRSLAYLISSKLPLTERGFAKGKESGDYTRLTTGLAGSRSLPIGFTLDTEAERIAYDAMVGKIAGHTSGHTEIEADRIASAKQDLIEKLDSTKLQKLQDDRTITPSEYKRIKRSYFNPTTGQLRNPLIVMLRSAEDKNKTVWRQVYRAATDRQRDLMEDYIAGHEGSGYAAEAKEKNALLLDWMKTYRKRNPILREVW